MARVSPKSLLSASKDVSEVSLEWTKCQYSFLVKSQSGKDILLKNELGFKRAMGTAKRTTADMIFTETEDALSHYKNRLTIVKSKFEWENSLSSMLYIDAQAMAQAWREGHE